MKINNFSSVITIASALLLSAVLPQAAHAGAVRALPGFTTNTLLANDDLYTGSAPLGFTVNYYGLTFSNAYVNNNGNITFDAPLPTYTPFDLTSTGQQIIAPFFADVDTRYAGSQVTYGNDVVDGHPAFGVNWVDVDYFYSAPTHTNRNNFQLILIDRSDTGANNFDIEFNYDQIQWEAGTASGSDANGLGGFSARAGYSNGTGESGTFFELPGSAINGAFLDSSLTSGLIHNSQNSNVLGRYLFRVRNGRVILSTLTLSPTDATDAVGQTHSVVASVAIEGNPVASQTVSFTVSGANTGSGSCTTDVSGSCSFSYTGTNAGDDQIDAATTLGDNELTSSAVMHWESVQSSQCPLSQGYWKNHSDLWPVNQLTLGGRTYTRDELLHILNTPAKKGNSSLILAYQLIAAQLNIANGSDSAPALGYINDANSALSGFAGKLPYNVKANSSVGQSMIYDAKMLDGYNNGSLTPNCIQ
jgi:hypothetical protein